MRFGYRAIIVALASMAVLVGAQLLLPLAAAEAAGNTGTRGAPVKGVQVQPEKLPKGGGGPGQVRDTPRLYPVDQPTYALLKSQANEQALARTQQKPGSITVTSGPAPQFPTLHFGQTGGWNPPDGALAVGPDSVFVAVNEAFAAYPRTGGTPILGPTSLPAFFGTSDSTFDPRAIYDAAHGRFVTVAVTLNTSSARSNYALAISNTSDPRGSWTTYLIDAVTRSGGVAAWADYPTLAMDGTNLYLTSNQFAFGSNSFQFARLMVIAKSGAYSGTVTPTNFTIANPDGSLAFSVHPANEPDALPGDGNPMYLVNARWPSGSTLAVRSVTMAGGTPVLGVPSSVNVAPYSLPPAAPAPGRGRRAIDTGDTRITSAVYRFGNIYSANTTANASTGLAAAQWYAFPTSALGGTTITATSHTIAGSSIAYYFPGVMPGNGFVGIGVSGSGATQTASAFLSKNGDAPTAYAGGVGGYMLNNRWGDYPGISADPNSNSTVWVLGEYARSTGGWGTAVASIGQ